MPEFFSIAVRELCEFTAKKGDLDLRFTPSPSAEQGRQGHHLIGSRRGAGYETELSLEGVFQQGNFELRVRGRADGYNGAAHLLEEFKTCIGDPQKIKANHVALHWAQLKIYGWLKCSQMHSDSITLGLVYLDVLSQKETTSPQLFSAQILRHHFDEQCQQFLDFAKAQALHRSARNASLMSLKFAHSEFRAGQRELAKSVYRTAMNSVGGATLLAQAPTGIGKTMGVIFPLLKAMPEKNIDKVFYLTAKGTGRQLAIDSLVPLHSVNPQTPLRAIELIARDNACVNLDKACNGDSCPLAKGFYDRIANARDAALLALDTGQVHCLDQLNLRSIALKYEVCPYYLSQDLVRWCDMVIGDYNYFFDLSAMLHALTVLNDWKVAVLIDEAHNLIDRGRAMYSAQLSLSQLSDARTLARQNKLSLVRKPLNRAYSLWKQLSVAQEEPYKILTELPLKLLEALQESQAALAAYQAEQSEPIDSLFSEFMLSALRFGRVAELFDSHSMMDQTVSTSHKTLRKIPHAMLAIRNVVPAPWLAPRFESAHCTIAFSATITPWSFYRQMLGMPEATPFVNVPSPFGAEQLQVHLAKKISTRYKDRARSLMPIADLMAQQFHWAPGNYLAFFSSFDYLEQVLTALQENYPQIPVWVQNRGMDDIAREAFLNRFTLGGQGIGFAVLGGVFGEGIDLPGKRLIGAFVATLGLPQLNATNEHMRTLIEKRFGSGYEFTYLYPGLQKVVQAAGRVIRGASDSGVVHLIDDRFKTAQVRALLPSWWGV